MTQPTTEKVHLPRDFRHEYQCWKSMRRRCAKPSDVSWKYYGALGVKVCERWNSFSCFLEDMGVAPTPEHQIDRIRNEDGYQPSNCYWSTPAEQQANTSKIHFLTFKDVTLPLAKWSEIMDIKATTIRSRIDLGWTVEEALTTPTIAKFAPKKTAPAKASAVEDSSLLFIPPSPQPTA